MKSQLIMRSLLLLPLCMVINVCPSCTNQRKAVNDHQMETRNSKLIWIKKANPVIDADKAISRIDLRFLAVKGYTITVPGIDDYHERFSEKFQFRIIEGTTDALHNEEDIQLQNQAVEYAIAYNVIIRDYILK